MSAAVPPSYPAGAGPPPGGPGGAPVPDSYFTESRKGEINELRNLLRGFATERDPQRKRDIIKKVIAYMTLGIDVSRLFTEMMMAIETRDLVIKKMVYLYLTNYARTHPQLAQMCTNTLVKDCGNDDPMVRGLALRALCGLNLPLMVEYIAEPLRRSLQDGHPYVRKTGVLGILKLYYLDPDSFESSGFVDILYDMLRDADASVVCNCIIVLNEVMQNSPNGGMAINRAIMLHLLNRIHEFNEFAKVQVLDLVSRYIPAHEDEGYQIMNLLDPVLRSSSSAAVMATVRAFMSLAEQIGDDTDLVKRQIVARVKPCLVTQISAGSSEMMYSLLQHVLMLTEICPGVFDDEYRQFYVRYNEPTHVKYLKLGILPNLANADTAPDIVSELAELVADATNPKFSRLAVRSMAKIACSGRGGPGAAEAIARRLVDMLDLNVDHISSEAASALALMVRRQPTLKTLVAPPLVRSLRYMKEPTGRASLVFLLAECGDIVPEAPYALEKLIDSYDDISSAAVKSALLSSTMRLFFVRPPECQTMLGRLLARATNDVSSQDVHDRALLYYRLLHSGVPPTTLQSIVQTNTHVPETLQFTEENDQALMAQLTEEFDTLSVIFGKPSANFIDPEYQVKYVKMPEEHPLVDGGSSGAAAAVAPGAVPTTGMAPPGAPVAVAAAPPPPAAPVAAAAAPPPPAEMDLLGFGGPPVAPAAPQPPVAAATTTATTGGLTLAPVVAMTGEEYQAKWAAVPDGDALVSTVVLNALPSSTDQVEQALLAHAVHTMASGELATEFKFFLYAHDTTSQNLLLIQSNLEKTAGEPLMIVTVKVSPEQSGGLLAPTTTTSTSTQTLVDGLIAIMTRALQ